MVGPLSVEWFSIAPEMIRVAPGSLSKTYGRAYDSNRFFDRPARRTGYSTHRKAYLRSEDGGDPAGHLPCRLFGNGSETLQRLSSHDSREVSPRSNRRLCRRGRLPKPRNGGHDSRKPSPLQDSAVETVFFLSTSIFTTTSASSSPVVV